MRSASSADRSAICVTFSLPHENAVELQNMAHSCAGRLRELGVLAVQVGNSTAIALQPRAGNSCQSVDHAGTRDRRQQTLNATRTNIARYLGADISTFPPVAGSGIAADSDVQNNSVRHENVTTVASVSTGVAKDQYVNAVAESSPHIVNLLQHDVVSSRSVCLSSSMPMSSVSDVRPPRKRARRRTQSSAAEVSVPLSMLGTADCTNSVYSFQQPSLFMESSTGIPSVHNIPAEQFKIPESRKKKAGSSRKTAAAKSQQLLPVPVQVPSNSLTDSFNAGLSECSKSSDVGMMFHATSSYSMGDRFQINGVNPYHRIPVMTADWQTYTTRSVPSNGLYQSLAAPSQYPHEYGHHRFRFAGNVDYSSVAANRVSDVGSYRNITPGSSVVFVSDASQIRLKEEHVPSVLPTQILRWSSATESKSASVSYGSNNSGPIPNVRAVYNMTHNSSGGLPVANIMQQQRFLTSRSDGSKPFTATGTSASENMVHLSVSSDIDRIKNVPVSDAPNISSLSGGRVNVPPSVNYQRANGLFVDVHSAALSFHGHAAHVKMNGDVDCLQHADSQTLSKCETVFEKSTAVTVPPYAPLASLVPTCIGLNCVPERQLQQPPVQLASKVQQCGLANFEDTGLNGCSSSTTSDMSKLSVSSGMMCIN